MILLTDEGFCVVLVICAIGYLFKLRTAWKNADDSVEAQENIDNEEEEKEQ